MPESSLSGQKGTVMVREKSLSHWRLSMPLSPKSNSNSQLPLRFSQLSTPLAI